MSLPAFQFLKAEGLRQKFIQGRGSLVEAGRQWAQIGCKKVLLVTDQSMVSLGYAARLIENIQAEGIEVFVDDTVVENPDSEKVGCSALKAKELGVEGIVGLGGGSSMDTAKACNLLCTHGGSIHDFWGKNKTRQPLLPLMLVPTTTGTGSETQSYALISDVNSKRKMACGDDQNLARVVILDPELTLTQPRSLFVMTGVDALAHALESGVSRASHDLSVYYSKLAFDLIWENLYWDAESQDVGRYEKLQVGATCGGLAIERSMLGAAHACANPLTAKFGVPHGLAIAWVLPYVLQKNGENESIQKRYQEWFGVSQYVKELIKRWQILNIQTMREWGIQEKDLQGLSSLAMQEWTGKFTPIELDEDCFDLLYQNCWNEVLYQ